MRLTALDVDAGQELADGTRIDVAVRVAGVERAGVVVVDGKGILESLFPLQLLKDLEPLEHAEMLVLLDGVQREQDRPRERLTTCAQVLKQGDKDRPTAFHIAGAAPRHPVAALELLAHVRRQIHREHGAPQQVRFRRQRLERPIVRCPDRIHMTVPDDRAGAFALRAREIGKDVGPLQRIARELLPDDARGMRGKIRDRPQGLLEEIRRVLFGARLPIHAAHGNEITRDRLGAHSDIRIFHNVLLFYPVSTSRMEPSFHLFIVPSFQPFLIRPQPCGAGTERTPR